MKSFKLIADASKIKNRVELEFNYIIINRVNRKCRWRNSTRNQRTKFEFRSSLFNTL